jgi:hypothetical protein
MSTPDGGSSEPAHGLSGRTITFVYDGSGRSIGPGEARRSPERAKAEVSYDPARHVIRITEPSGEVAEFDDRPVRCLVLERNPITKALEPATVRGEPMYLFLSRELVSNR